MAGKVIEIAALLGKMAEEGIPYGSTQQGIQNLADAFLTQLGVIPGSTDADLISMSFNERYDVYKISARPRAMKDKSSFRVSKDVATFIINNKLLERKQKGRFFWSMTDGIVVDLVYVEGLF
jgi:hypothetical protein